MIDVAYPRCVFNFSWGQNKLKTLLLVLLTLLCSMQHTHADPLSDCINTLEHDAALQPISDKVSLAGKTDRQFSMMANESFPTPSEKEAIFAWATKRERCINDNPPIAQVNREGFNAVQSLILDLYKGTITYGQFTRQRQEIAKTVDAKKQQIIMQLLQQNQQQQMQQQQYQQQEEYLYQACMNRARDIYQRNACQMERAGRQLGGALSR